MSNRTEVVAGMVFRAPYPFIREMISSQDEDGYSERLSWRPGIRQEYVGSYSPESEPDTEAQAEGTGEILLTIVSIHKPGRFPTRVFYTRKWKDPDGREWGKGACRCATSEKFMRLARGYRFPFVIKPYDHEKPR